MLFILTVLELNTFLKRLKKLLETKRYLEYKQIIQYCVDIFAFDFMLATKTLIEYTSLFSPYDFLKYDNIILSYFKHE